MEAATIFYTSKLSDPAKKYLHDRGLIVGATDTRFEGHTLDRMSRKARYDPADAAIGTAVSILRAKKMAGQVTGHL